MRKNKKAPPRNNVKKYRSLLNLTQRELAVKSGVSQQHIQRIETSDVNIGFDLAIRLCHALGQSLPKVFPSTAHIVVRLSPDDTDPVSSLLHHQEAMRRAGINMDPRQWEIHLMLRGHNKPYVILLADGEDDRLWRSLQEDEPLFAGFEGANGRQYLVCKRDLIAWTFVPKLPISLDIKEDDDIVALWFSDMIPPINLRVSADESEDDGFYQWGQLNGIVEALNMLESEESDDAFQFFRTFRVYDKDDAAHFFRTSKLTMFSAPSNLIAESRWDEFEGEDPPKSAKSLNNNISQDKTDKKEHNHG